MRRPNEDKLDEMIRENSLKANLIKWWNVVMKMPEPEPENSEELSEEDNAQKMDDDVFSEGNTVIYDSILKDNKRDEDPFEKAMEKVRKEEEENSIAEANEIYERLMREAQEDEEKKQREIEEARRKAESDG